VGLRSQIVWLTFPLLAYVVGAELAPPGATTISAASPSVPASPRAERARPLLVAYVTGALAWFVPLVVVSGGPRAYWRALFSQGAEDFSGVRMLWTTPTLRQLIDALYYAFVSPWAVWWLAAAVLVLGAVGVASLWRRNRSALALVAVSFGPYL